MPWVEKSQVTVVAILKDSNGGTHNFVNDVTFTIVPTALEGVAINDTETYTTAPSNDFSFDPADPDNVAYVSPANEAAVMVYAFDYGGSFKVTATTTLSDGSQVTGDVIAPLDTDSDTLPDIWEEYHEVVGFDKFNKNSFSPDLSDGNTDIDQSLDNTYDGDKIVNFREYRGIVFDNSDGSVVSHMRLNPMMKDLFFRGDNFANSIPPGTVPNVLNFSVAVPGGSAFEEARIAVHDVTGMLSFSNSIEPPNIDILAVQNVTDTTKNELRDDDGYINHYAARSWSWDYKGVSYSGRTEIYSYDPALNKKGTFLYHLNLMHYVYDHPYMDEVIDDTYPGWNTYQAPLNADYINLLDPLDKVEDYYLENGNGPESIHGNKENRFRTDQSEVLDGDHMMIGWTSNVYVDGGEPYYAGYDFSVFDADGDGLVEWPVVGDPLGQLIHNPDNPDTDSNGNAIEYTPAWLQLHTAIHESGHGTGINLHTYDHSCAMDNDNLSWDRAGHFSDLARSLILIHNQTEF